MNYGVGDKVFYSIRIKKKVRKKSNIQCTVNNVFLFQSENYLHSQLVTLIVLHSKIKGGKTQLQTNNCLTNGKECMW